MGQLTFLFCLLAGAWARYEPNWDSLDTRPLPAWYDGAKVGVFINWGVYSVPSMGSSGSDWFWNFWHKKVPDYVEYMEKNYRPDFTYADFAAKLTAEFYDPEQWASVFQASGAKYIVVSSKHHEGFTMWPSKYSWNWNAGDVGPKRDLIGDLATAMRNKTPEIHFGIYHSLFEWFNPLYVLDFGHLFTTNDFVTRKTMPELYELVNSYKPDIIWSDGDWDAPSSYWNSTGFLAWLFNDSPVKDTVVVNDRWGSEVKCHHGSFYTCQDRYNPGVLQNHKWENCMTLDRKSWGFRRTAAVADYLTFHELMTQVVSTVSCGGNILINIGPTHEGLLPPIMEERLRELGTWLGINGAAIYDTQPWIHQNDSLTPGVWYTQKSGVVFAMVLTWPDTDNLTLASVQPTNTTRVKMLGYGNDLQYTAYKKGIQVVFPRMSQVTSEVVWTLQMENVNPSPPTQHPYPYAPQGGLDEEHAKEENEINIGN